MSRSDLYRQAFAEGAAKNERIKTLENRVAELEAGISEHWQESTHGATANMRHADSKLHALIGL